MFKLDKPYTHTIFFIISPSQQLWRRIWPRPSPEVLRPHPVPPFLARRVFNVREAKHFAVRHFLILLPRRGPRSLHREPGEAPRAFWVAPRQDRPPQALPREVQPERLSHALLFARVANLEKNIFFDKYFFYFFFGYLQQVHAVGRQLQSKL